MTIQQLTYLLEVHKCGSFSVAAKNLFITQSAISNAVIGLEKEIGAPIFIRSKKGLVPTPRGADVIEHAKRACENIEQITAPRKSEKKTVRIGCNGFVPANKAFLRLVKEIRNRKDIEIAFLSQTEGDFLDRLLKYELDIVFFFNLTSYSMGRLESVKKHNLEHVIFREVPAAVKISPRHPLYNKPNIDLWDFAKYKMVQNSRYGIATTRTFPSFFPVRQENILPISNSKLRDQILAEGHAFSIEMMPVKSSPEDTFRYIPIEGLRYTCYYVTNPNVPKCEELQRFIMYFKEELELEKA